MNDVTICPCCGYDPLCETHNETKGEDTPVEYGTPFIEIFTEHKLKISNEEPCAHGDYNYESYHVVTLTACPRCRTVLLNTD